MLFGATGAGKTTTARRLIAARTLAQHAALLVLDQKGDQEDVEQMQQLAAEAGVPFILFDSQDPRPIAGSRCGAPRTGSPPDAVEPVRQSEPYYYDVLRRHLDIVCKVLHAAGSLAAVGPVPDRLLPTAALPDSSSRSPSSLADSARALTRRAREHGRYVQSPQGIKDLSGGANRLEVALALAGRQLVTPRAAGDGETVAVRLVEALRQRAVVMWRTHADTMPDEAAALSVLALADLHDAAEHAGAPWTLLLDEFGAVIKMAAARGVAILQRGRSHHGQVIVITQSSADIEALTGQPGLLASLTDNFAGIVAHRQTSPGVPRLAGEADGHPRALADDQPDQRPRHQHTGRGSARRVREFRIGSDTFGALDRGEAVIYTPLAGDPQPRAHRPGPPPRRAARTDRPRRTHGTRCEITVHPEDSLHDPAPPTDGPTVATPSDEEGDPDNM